MKYLIVGIGNMGAEYEDTRHNIGFAIVDAIARAHQGSWKNAYLGDICEVKFRGRTLILLKPSTFVNLSGKAVRYWLQKAKVQIPHLLVVVDDMNLPFGRLRLRAKGSDGGHNGLKDINQTIGNSYARLRIGIGNAPKGRHTDFVLGQWDTTEKEQLPDIIEKAKETALNFTTMGIERAIQNLGAESE